MPPFLRFRSDQASTGSEPTVGSPALQWSWALARLRPRGVGFAFMALILGCAASSSFAQVLAAAKVTRNTVETINHPLRYRPDGTDFVIENGTEYFNRPLYGGNTAFRVDAGDRPEFSLYLPGRGGNLRLGIQTTRGTKWLHDADAILSRYRPGEMIYEIHDAFLGAGALLRIEALALAATEGLVLRSTMSGASGPMKLFWVYGGANGERGRRDGDIGTEAVPISEYFQLKPEYCRDNRFDVGPGQFRLRSAAATVLGLSSTGADFTIGDASHWNEPGVLLARGERTSPTLPVVVGRANLTPEEPFYILLQRISDRPIVAEELATYRAVRKERADTSQRPNVVRLAAPYRATELPQRFAEAETHFAQLRSRVSVQTPDPFINAAVAALNVASDAVWDEPQAALMHGAIAWRSRLLGWRGAYALDALGWHDRARQHFSDWARHQNTDAVPATLPPPDEEANLARSEAALHSNGDLSNSHYDMNLVYIDALFRHLRWTGDLAFAQEVWPMIERHLAWERRLFRREFGPEKLPLYEAYAAIWASDDLQYSGGGVTHASAYNYFHNREAARLARLFGHDATRYEREADLIARGLRELLWLPKSGGFGEFKDLLGLQRVHPSAALWTFYHAMDSELPTAAEAWSMTRKVDREIPWLPVTGLRVPADMAWRLPSTTNWMPYSWSINNVVMGESIHTALGYWQAGRAEDAFRITKSALLASMFMGICPGNVGSMNYLDVYRRESQRDFADGGGVTARAFTEGLFGVRPNLLDGTLWFVPGFPSKWTTADLQHPDVGVEYSRVENVERFSINPHFTRALALHVQLPRRFHDVDKITVNGRGVSWSASGTEDAVSLINFDAPAADRYDIEVTWKGALVGSAISSRDHMPTHAAPDAQPSGTFEPIDLRAFFNDKATQIFRNEYRAPRSSFVSLAIPKQGLGGWAGSVKATGDIDDDGLREVARTSGGRIQIPGGLTFLTPAEAGTPNILFTSLWSNYPREAQIPLQGRARHLWLLMAGSTNWMQSRIDNGEVVVHYSDGGDARLALENPTTWWPIDQDYVTDEFAFHREGPVPWRIRLQTGDVYRPQSPGGKVPGGAATVLHLALDPSRELQSLTLRTLSNEVVIGLMAVTLTRP